MIAITTRSSISVKPSCRATAMLPVALRRSAARCTEVALVSCWRLNSTWGDEPPGSGPALADPLGEVLSPADSPSVSQAHADFALARGSVLMRLFVKTACQQGLAM